MELKIHPSELDWVNDKKTDFIYMSFSMCFQKASGTSFGMILGELWYPFGAKFSMFSHTSPKMQNYASTAQACTDCISGRP